MRAIRWSVRRVARGRDVMYEGTVELPDQLGHTVKLSTTAHQKDKALARTAALASKALDNPAVQAVLPPGAAPALKALGKLASSPGAAAALRRVRRWF